MKLLWVATKSPWPARDGGRRLLAESLAALAGAGVRATLVAPAEPGADSRRARADLRAAPGRGATRGPPRELGACGRHRRAADARPPPLAGARARGRGARRRTRLRPGRRRAAPRPGGDSAGAPARCAGAAARAERRERPLARRGRARSGSARDRLRPRGAASGRARGRGARRLRRRRGALGRGRGGLARLAGARARVLAIPPPFPALLPAGSLSLPGAPSLVLFGSRGWLPNVDAERSAARRSGPRSGRDCPGRSCTASAPARRPARPAPAWSTTRRRTTAPTPSRPARSCCCRSGWRAASGCACSRPGRAACRWWRPARRPRGSQVEPGRQALIADGAEELAAARRAAGRRARPRRAPVRGGSGAARR